MNAHSFVVGSSFRTFLFASVVGTCSSALAATLYYVPSAEPYLWTDNCWFKDSAGTNPSALPTIDDAPYLGFAGLKNKTLSIPSGTDAKSGALQMRTEYSTLQIEDGATLTFGHTVTAGKMNNTTIRVKSGGALIANSYFHLADSSRKNVRLVVEEGGTANFASNEASVGNNSSGSAFFENHGDTYFNSTTRIAAYLGWTEGSAVSTAKCSFDNYGTLRTRSSGSQVFVVGAGAGTTGYLTNHVDAVANFDMTLSVGGGTNSTGFAVNNGTMKVTRNLAIGGDSISSSRDNITEGNGSTGTLRNNAELTTAAVYLGGHKYGNGTLDNAGTLTLGGNLTVADRQGTTGHFFARAGSTTTMNGDCTVSYYGNATFTAEGDAKIVGSKKGLWIANEKADAIGRVVLSGTSSWCDPGAISVGYGGTTQADLELSDSAKIENAGTIVIGRGSTKAVDDKQRARVVLSGQAMITNHAGNVYLATNNYGRAELEIADEAVLDFADVATSRALNVASSHSGTSARLLLRGGLIRMPATNATVRIGYANYTTAKCNGILQGWGRIIRYQQNAKNSSNNGLNLFMPCGAIVADGEGVMRDLDLSAVRRINASDTPGENLSGTNGFYAINKGRLYFPCRYTGYVNLGSYYSETKAPRVVNGVTFAFTEKPSDSRLHGQLYATDREDIPSGLPEDRAEKGVKRLGVWRAALRSSYKSEEFETSEKRDFTSARATVRYDNYALDALRDEEGNFRSDQRIALYQYRNGWQKIASLPVETAEADHRIAGTLLPTEDDWNMGFFAVVAEVPHGTVLTVR